MDFLPDGVALVTGAAQGLGEQVCLQLAREGIATLILVDLDEGLLEKVASKCKASAGNPDFVASAQPLDLTNREKVTALFRGIVRDYGRLDYAVNCAGIIRYADSFESFSDAEYDLTCNVNQRAVFFCLKEEAAIMLKQEVPIYLSKQGRKRDRGVIVNVSSGAGSVAIPNNPAYVASKHAVQGLTKSLAFDHAKDGLRVNCVAPGAMTTRLLTAVGSAEDAQRYFAPKIPAQRIADPQEVANVIVFLLSPLASYMHGETVNVDGGYLTA